MKKLKFEEGAVTPLWLKDLEYMQEGFEETVKAVIEGLSLGKKDVLVSGCKITLKNSKISMTSGWCYYDGEILPVKALEETACRQASPKIYFTKKTERDPSGNRIINKEDGMLTCEPYFNEYLEPQIVPTGTNVTYKLAISQGAWCLGERIIKTDRYVDTGVVELTIDDESIDRYSTLKYRQIGGVVQLYGNISSINGVTGNIAGGLPCPAEKVNVKIADHEGNNNIDVTVTIDGVLNVNNLESSIRLDSIIYLADVMSSVNSDGHHSNYSDIQEGASGNQGGLT